MKSIKRHLEIMTTLNENTVTIPMVRQMAQRALDDMNGQINNPDVVICPKPAHRYFDPCPAITAMQNGGSDAC